MTAPVSQVLSEAAWSQYANDLNAMTDDEIEYEYQSSLRLIEEEESWVEAVAAWRAAGSPRRPAALAKEQGR